jgi:molybdenum cofactor cytidylyltransferase
MIKGILLAAGSGSRFGGAKLLHPLPDGIPIGVAALRNLRSALPDSLAVVRSGDETLRRLLEAEGIRVEVCEDAHLGMARSLAQGIRAAMQADGWVIALGDMPFVRPSTIAAIVRRVEASGRIAMPGYRGQRGHPVGFGRRYREELLAVAGDEGARSVVRQHASEIEILESDDPGILRDIDARSDLET